MTISTIFSIISAALAIARYLISYAEQKKWIDAGAAAATLRGLQDADDAIKTGTAARAAARDIAARDPAGVLRDDDGFRRPDDR